MSRTGLEENPNEQKRLFQNAVFRSKQKIYALKKLARTVQDCDSC